MYLLSYFLYYFDSKKQKAHKWNFVTAKRFTSFLINSEKSKRGHSRLRKQIADILAMQLPISSIKRGNLIHVPTRDKLCVSISGRGNEEPSTIGRFVMLGARPLFPPAEWECAGSVWLINQAYWKSAVPPAICLSRRVLSAQLTLLKKSWRMRKRRFTLALFLGRAHSQHGPSLSLTRSMARCDWVICTRRDERTL